MAIEVEIVGGRNDGATVAVPDGSNTVTFLRVKPPTWINLIKDTVRGDELATQTETMLIQYRHDGRPYVISPKGY